MMVVASAFIIAIGLHAANQNPEDMGTPLFCLVIGWLLFMVGSIKDPGEGNDKSR